MKDKPEEFSENLTFDGNLRSLQNTNSSPSGGSSGYHQDCERFFGGCLLERIWSDYSVSSQWRGVENFTQEVSFHTRRQTRKRTNMVTGRLILFSLIAITVSTRGAMGDVGIVQGTYNYIVRPQSQKPPFTASYTFEIAVSGCCWVISYEDLAAKTNADILNSRSVACYDGTNIYLTQFQNPDAVRKAWGDHYEAIKPTLPIAQSEIFPGNYPPPDPPVLQHLWFAFASGCIFSKSSGEAKPPTFVDLAIFYRPAFKSTYFWTTNSGLSKRQITIFNEDGRLLSRDRQTGHVGYMARPRFTKGYTSGVGIWTGVTNIGESVFPLSFEYYENAPTAFKGDELLKTYSYSCVVTNVVVGNVLNVPVQLPAGMVLVRDRRLLEDGYARLDYIVTNGWAPADDPYITAQLRGRPKWSAEDEVLESMNIHPSHAQRLKYAALIALGLPACLLLLWASVRWKQHAKPTLYRRERLTKR